MNSQSDQPREDHDDEFLGVMLPELRADGDDEGAKALVAEYIRKHGRETS